jgi:hypothetical protein
MPFPFLKPLVASSAAISRNDPRPPLGERRCSRFRSKYQLGGALGVRASRPTATAGAAVQPAASLFCRRRPAGLGPGVYSDGPGPFSYPVGDTPPPPLRGCPLDVINQSSGFDTGKMDSKPPSVGASVTDRSGSAQFYSPQDKRKRHRGGGDRFGRPSHRKYCVGQAGVFDPLKSEGKNHVLFFDARK